MSYYARHNPEGRGANKVPLRGYHVIYRENETNHCPGCGRSHWIIGRVSAECGFCSTAVPFAVPRFASAMSPSGF